MVLARDLVSEGSVRFINDMHGMDGRARKSEAAGSPRLGSSPRYAAQIRTVLTWVRDVGALLSGASFESKPCRQRERWGVGLGAGVDGDVRGRKKPARLGGE